MTCGLSKLLARPAFENAIRVMGAIGGSTNAVLHLLAFAGRLGVALELEDFDRLTRDIPLLVNLQPSGRFLMEDLHYAGGLPAVMKELAPRLHLDAPTVLGPTLGESIPGAECFNREVIHTLAEPVSAVSGIWVMKGNLCPNGAVVKPSAASQSLFHHRGRAVVFESIEDLRCAHRRSGAGRRCEFGAGAQGLRPDRLSGHARGRQYAAAAQTAGTGMQDMLRISDARMSGTAFGTVVLHVAPEAEAGGPLAHGARWR